MENWTEINEVDSNTLSSRIDLENINRSIIVELNLKIENDQKGTGESLLYMNTDSNLTSRNHEEWNADIENIWQINRKINNLWKYILRNKIILVHSVFK